MDLNKLQVLVDKCTNYLRSGHFPDAGKPETLTKQYLVEPLLRLLGWSEDPSQEFHYVSEFSGGMAKKWEDIVLMQQDMPMIFVETKELFEKKLLTDSNISELLNYLKEYNRKNKNRYRVDWGVLTNFKEIHFFYVSDTEPFCSLLFNDYMREVGRVVQLLSVDEIKRHGIELFYSESSKEKLGSLFLEDLKKWRLILANGLFEANPHLSVEQLRETSQKLLDRLIFIGMLETLGVLPPNWLGNIFAQWQQGKNYLNKTFSEVMREQFVTIESLYDTELFAKNLCDEVDISDDYLEEILKIQGVAKGTVYEKIGFAGQTSLDDKGIYGYNFNTLSIDIMGTAYERYLAHRIAIEEQRVVIKDIKKLRRKEGTYFTPTYVVKHIVEQTIEPKLKSILEDAKKLLEKGKFKDALENMSEISQLRILDPACGSGSFLIKAFDAISECYSEYNRSVDKATATFLKTKGLLAANEIELDAKVTDIGERILLENLYGIDLDPQAVEITKLNLWIRMLRFSSNLYRPTVGKKQRKLLPSLIMNIKCGNSLFSPLALVPSVPLEVSRKELADLLRMRRELSKTILELTPAHSGTRTSDEIDELK
jgi:hypothetical protein